jgi:hypothetical protein
MGALIDDFSAPYRSVPSGPLSRVLSRVRFEICRTAATTWNSEKGHMAHGSSTGENSARWRKAFDLLR